MADIQAQEQVTGESGGQPPDLSGLASQYKSDKETDAQSQGGDTSDGNAEPQTPTEGQEPSAFSAGDENGDEGQENAAPESKDGQGDDAALEITLSERWADKVDPASLESFKALGKKLGLNSEQASSLADWQLGQQAAIAEAQEAEWQKKHQVWQKQLKEDKEFGGENLKATLHAANIAARRFGGEVGPDGEPNEFVRLIGEMGLQSHPTMVRFAARIGQALADDSAEPGGSKPGKLSNHQQLKKIYKNSPELFK